MKRFSLLFTFVLAFGSLAWGQTYDSLRVMSYNLLNYPNASALRNPYFRKTLRAIDPDLIICPEMTSAAGVTDFLNNVLNFGQPGTYSSAVFRDGPDTDNIMYFRVSKLQHILPDTVLHTALRDINGYRLRPVGISADSLDIQIYAGHLKASSGGTNEADRAAEALILRNHLNSLPDGGYFMFGGDFNLYSSSEQAWTNLTGSLADNSGRLYDPINSPGSWDNNSSFAGIHTQSTRTRALSDGGSTGGLDSRFDFILFSQNFQDAAGWEYVPGSYKAFGNDGNHMNDSINKRPNTAVPDSIADALYYGSDHLPMRMTIRRQLASTASITVSKPIGGETWTVGYQDTIKWSSQNLTGTVTITLNRNYPSGTWETLFSGTANDGSEIWNISGLPSTAARIRITSVSQPTVYDESNANFTIRTPTITVTAPNTALTWYTGTAYSITWNSQFLPGNVTIQLNRSYTSATWETLFSGTANDGTQSWTASGASTTTARVRIISDAVATVGDTSDVNFAIVQPSISLLSPVSGESWMIGAADSILWTSAGLTGNVKLELNRDYPSSAIWETLFAGIANDNNEVWIVSGPIATHARVRITSISNPALTSMSPADFAITHSAPPVLLHDAHGDAVPGNVVFTAKVTDDLPGVTTKLFWRVLGSTPWDSVAMLPTVYPPEVSATLTLNYGTWEYFIRATDSDPQSTTTAVYGFTVAPACGSSISYDDGSAEQYNWSDSSGYAWAVKFTPASVPFYLCEASVAVAGFHPDSAHTPIRIQVLAADGVGGLPGTVLREVVKGSIGNMIGGLPGTGLHTARFVLHNGQSNPLVFSGDFYLSVANPGGGAEAFGLDTSSVTSGRSFVYDPCDMSWHAENGTHPSSRRGNRMIQVKGWYGTPVNLTIVTQGDDVILRWPSNGALYYRVYKSSTVDFATPVFVAETSSTSLTIPNALPAASATFYRVTASSAP